jgi:hypothetical protein
MKYLNQLIQLSCLFIIFMLSKPAFVHSQENQIPKLYQLENPMSVTYLQKNLAKKTPRLVLNNEIDQILKNKLKSDPVVQSFYQTLKKDAENIMELPLIERVMVGRRMSTGDTRQRLSTLGMVYYISKDKNILDRLNSEILAVCNFPDWNPSHYLDVAGTALAVALALDWAEKDLPETTIEIAKEALIKKGLLPSFEENENYGWRIDCHHNWNQVCHAGMIGAAIAVADVNPELAAKTLGRALNNMGLALVEYGPDGVYPEGASYWGFGTMHTLMSIAMFESAFGTDFGISDFPGFMESADFVALVTASSGEFYNYYDCGSNITEDKRGFGNSEVAMFNRSTLAANLLWFAVKTGNSFYYDESYFTDQSEKRRKQYFDGPALVWLAQLEPVQKKRPPLTWKGEGSNHLAIFKDEPESEAMFYLGAKGGKATNNHGNMDAGSFVFELEGVRWSIDLGNQSYHELEKTGFDLWSNCQECERWTLLTKNNYGHSTLTVNNQLHVADGEARIIDFKKEGKPEVTFDMTKVFGGDLKSLTRKFIKDSNKSLIVVDDVVLSDKTKSLTWQMMTTADVEIVEGGAILKQDGKELHLENLSHPDFDVSVVSLYPAPLKLDKQLEGLKRLEIRIPAWTIEGDKTKIKVRLSGE